MKNVSISNIINLVKLIEKRNKENKEKIMNDIINKNNRERNNYIENMKRCLEKEKEEEVLKKEKSFKRYQRFVSIIKLIILVLYNESK